jgi:hypothetical protein
MSNPINELFTRVKALERIANVHMKKIIDLQSQHNLVVDNITDLNGSVNQLEAALLELTSTVSNAGNDHDRRIRALEHAANGVLWPERQPPSTEDSSVDAPDHVCGALKIKPCLYLTEAASNRVRLHPVAIDQFADDDKMVATESELTDAFYPERGNTMQSGLRNVYNLGRQHEAEHTVRRLKQFRDAAPQTALPQWDMVKEWMAEIWHEGTPVQVSGSDVHIAHRAAQWGAAQATCPHIVTGDEETISYNLAEKTADQPRQEEPPAPSSAPVGELMDLVAKEIYDFTGDHVDDNEAGAVIHVVANWLESTQWPW